MELSDTLLALVDAEARLLSRRLPSGALGLEDLVGHGRVGLLEARDRWDARRGIPFELFARRRVRGAMLDALRAQGFLKRRGWEAARRARLAHAALEVAPVLAGDDDAAELARAAERLAVVFLTDEALSETPDEAPDPEVRLADASLRRRLQDALRGLATEDREVVDAFYDLDEQGRSGAELARHHGLSRSTLSRAHLRVIDRLRDRLTGVEA